MRKRKDEVYAQLVGMYILINRELKECMATKKKIFKKISKKRREVSRQHELWLQHRSIDDEMLDKITCKNKIVEKLIPYSTDTKYLKRSGWYDIVEMVAGERKFHWAGRIADFPLKIDCGCENIRR